MADDDSGDVKVPVGGISFLQGLFHSAYEEGKAGNDAAENDESHSVSEIHSKEQSEQMRKDSVAQQKAHNDKLNNHTNNGKKSVNEVLGEHLSRVSKVRPQLTDNVKKPKDVKIDAASEPQDVSENIIDNNSKNDSVLSSPKSANNILQGFANSRSDYNATAIRKNPIVRDAAKINDKVSKSNQQASQSTIQDLKSADTSSTQGSSGGTVSSGNGGTQPWWVKMQATLDDISDNIKKLSDAQGHSAPGPKGLLERVNKSGDSDSTGAPGGGLAGALGPIAGVLGMMIAAKFGGIGAQVVHTAGELVDNGGKALKGMINGAGAAERNVAGAAGAVGDTIAKDAKGAASFGERIFGGAKNLVGKVGDGAANLARGGLGRVAGSGGGLGKSFLGKVAGTAMLFGGIEAAGHAAKAYDDFRTGDAIGGSAETLRTAAKVSEYGGPKDMLSHVPVVGKFANKLPTPVRDGANWLARQVVMRGKAAAVDFAAGEATGGAETAGVSGIVAGVAGFIAPPLAAKGMNYVADRLDSKQGRKILGDIHNSNTVQDALKLGSSAGKLGDKVGLGWEAAAVGGIAGAAGGLVVDAGKSALNGAKSIASAEFHGVQTAANGIGGMAQNTMSALAKLLGNEGNSQNKTPAAIATNNAQNGNSVAQKAQAAVASNPGMNRVPTAPAPPGGNNSSITINLPNANMTSVNDGKKVAQVVGDALKRQQQQQASQNKAKESFSNVSPGGNFSFLNSGAAFLASIF